MRAKDAIFSQADFLNFFKNSAEREKNTESVIETKSSLLQDGLYVALVTQAHFHACVSIYYNTIIS